MKLNKGTFACMTEKRQFINVKYVYAFLVYANIITLPNFVRNSIQPNSTSSENLYTLPNI